MLITLGWLRVGSRQPVLIVVTRWLMVSLISAVRDGRRPV